MRLEIDVWRFIYAVLWRVIRLEKLFDTLRLNKIFFWLKNFRNLNLEIFYVFLFFPKQEAQKITYSNYFCLIEREIYFNSIEIRERMRLLFVEEIKKIDEVFSLWRVRLALTFYNCLK